MSRHTTKLLKAVLSVLHYTGAGSMMAPFTRGVGVVFMLHHVRPDPPHRFEPNRILSVTPEFLEGVVREVRAAGFDIVSLDEAHGRLGSAGTGRPPFACFTFDDGYRDNREHAYPVLKRLEVPFAIYVPTDYPDGNGFLWWLALERVIRELPAVAVDMDGRLRTFRCRSIAEKEAAFHRIYWWLRRIPEDSAREVVRQLAQGIGLDPRTLCRELMMTWEEIRALGQDPLVTIGAHTRRHYALAKLPAAEARREIEQSVERIEHELDRPCRHFSFPYGDEASAGQREFVIAAGLGLKTAVTTCKGLVHRRHADHPTALPRVSLNGEYQDARFVKLFLSGAPFALWNMLRLGGPQRAAH